MISTLNHVRPMVFIILKKSTIINHPELGEPIHCDELSRGTPINRPESPKQLLSMGLK